MQAASAQSSAAQTAQEEAAPFVDKRGTSRKLRQCTRSIAASDAGALDLTGENIDRSEVLARNFVDEIRQAISGFDPKNPNIVMLFPIVPLLMARAEQYPEVKGPERKMIVLLAIKTALQIVTPLPYQPLVLPLVDQVIGPFIDASIQTTKLLNALSKNASKRCFAWCLKKTGSDVDTLPAPTASNTAASNTAASNDNDTV